MQMVRAACKIEAMGDVSAGNVPLCSKFVRLNKSAVGIANGAPIEGGYREVVFDYGSDQVVTVRVHEGRLAPL